MAGMKYVWKITAGAGSDGADHPACYAYAGSMREALELAGEPDAKAIPQVGRNWQGADGVQVIWGDLH
jgi:hypothetical protein